MKTRNTPKQTYKKEFINGVYRTIASHTSLTNEEASKILNYLEKIDVTKWYKNDKENVEKMLSYGSIKYRYKENDAIIDAWKRGEEWAETISKRLNIG